MQLGIVSSERGLVACLLEIQGLPDSGVVGSGFHLGPFRHARTFDPNPDALCSSRPRSWKTPRMRDQKACSQVSNVSVPVLLRGFGFALAVSGPPSFPDVKGFGFLVYSVSLLSMASLVRIILASDLQRLPADASDPGFRHGPKPTKPPKPS